MQSNTYRRSKCTNTPHSRWELTYGTIAARLLRKGNLNTQNAFSLAKFLGAFVYLFSFPYSVVKTWLMKRKMKAAE